MLRFLALQLVCCFPLSLTQAPSSPPTGFTVAVLSDTSLRLNWRAPPVEDWNAVSLTGFHYCVARRTVSKTSLNCDNMTLVAANNESDYEYSQEVTGLRPLTAYFCSVSASNSHGSSPFTPEISVTTSGNEHGFFELSLKSHFVCQEWILNYGGSSSLFADLIHYIRTNCNCNFNGNGGAIDTVEVSCRDESEDKVVVRARLVAPTDSSLSSMLSLIEDWKYNTRSVLVGGQRLDIDLSCPTSIHSLYSPECHTQSYAIAGGILGAIFSAAVLMACVLVVIGVVKNRKHFKRKKAFSYLRMTPQKSQGEVYSVPTLQQEEAVSVSSLPVAVESDTKPREVSEVGRDEIADYFEKHADEIAQLEKHSYQSGNSPSLPTLPVDPTTLQMTPVGSTILPTSAAGSIGSVKSHTLSTGSRRLESHV